MNPEVRDVLDKVWRTQTDPKYVFVAANGRPFNPDHFSKRHLRKALTKAGVREITFHVLRHTYASNFVMNGGSIYDLQKILGHTKVEMTMIYAHHSPEHLKGAIETVRFSKDGNQSTSPYLALVNAQQPGVVRDQSVSS
jgi:site-specific recombinase XerD